MVSHFSQPGTFTIHRVESPNPVGDVNLSSEVAAGANGQFDNLKNLGPLPKGEYLIGMPERNEKFHKLRPDGDNIWYPLYRVGGSNNSRSGFYIHAGKVSHGCGTIESEVPMSSAQYPRSREYTKLRREFDNTTPFTGETPPKTRQYQLLNPPDLSKRLYIGRLTVN